MAHINLLGLLNLQIGNFIFYKTGFILYGPFFRNDPPGNRKEKCTSHLDPHILFYIVGSRK
jgi:hypothetical protein